MSKPKRPIFKYEIKQHNVTNIHSGHVSRTYFTVEVKDISTWGNCWLSLDIYAGVQMFRNEHEYCFSSLVHAKKALSDYVENKRERFENRTENVSSIVEKGIL